MKRLLLRLSTGLLAAGSLWALAQNTAEPKPPEEKPVPETQPFNPTEQIPVDVAVDFPADI